MRSRGETTTASVWNICERKLISLRALEAALRGQEKFENYLLEKGYVRSPGGEVRELTLAYFKKLLPVNFLVKFASMRLPAGGTTAVPTVG